MTKYTISKLRLTVVDVKQSAAQKHAKLSVIQWCKTSWRRILSEFISTTSLVFFGCMVCIPLDGYVVQPPIYAAIGFGLVILINVQIFGHISGTQINPAVTFASVIWGGTAPVLGILYVIVQSLGSTFGYFLLMLLAPNDLDRDGFCVTQPKTTLTNMQAVGIEAVLTAALVLLCCSLWDPQNEHKQDSTSIKFGLTIIGLSMGGGPLTGASMNPARSLGPAIITGKFTGLWVYWVGPLIGGTVALFVYKYIWLAVDDDKPRESQPLLFYTVSDNGKYTLSSDL